MNVSDCRHRRRLTPPGRRRVAVEHVARREHDRRAVSLLGVRRLARLHGLAGDDAPGGRGERRRRPRRLRRRRWLGRCGRWRGRRRGSRAGGAAVAAGGAVACGACVVCGVGSEPPWGTLSCWPGTISELSFSPLAASSTGNRTPSFWEIPNSVSPWTTVYRSPVVGTGDVGTVGCVGGAVCGANVGARGRRRRVRRGGQGGRRCSAARTRWSSALSTSWCSMVPTGTSGGLS